MDNSILKTNSIFSSDEGYIFSLKKDLLIFILPLFVVPLFSGWISEFFNNPEILVGGTHVYVRLTLIEWLFSTLLDSPHVYSTAYILYMDKEVLKKRKHLYIFIPVLVIFTMFLFFNYSERVAFQVFTYANMYHLIRQQYGWFRISYMKSKNWILLNKAALTILAYNCTLIPLLMWHFNPSMDNRTGWIFDGDMLLSPSEFIYSLLVYLHWFLNILFLGLVVWGYKNRKPLPLGFVIVFISTWVAWYGGIVYKISGDETFLLDVLHIIPYIAFTFAVYKKNLAHLKKVHFANFYFLLGFFGLLTGIIFSFYTTRDPGIGGLIALSVLTGLSISHYILDGFIWKVQNQNSHFLKWLKMN